MAEKQGYNTKSRKYILEYLKEKKDVTVSASDILQFLNKNAISVNEATVYRYLNKLTRERKVLKIFQKDTKAALYQLVETEKDCNEHIHIKCVGCGKLEHLHCDFMKNMREHLSEDHGFLLRCDGSILYGTCAECKKSI